MTIRALVTGGHGFVAQWAIRAMLERGWEVTAAGIGGDPPTRVLSTREHDSVRWRSMDITRQDDVVAALEDSAPEFVLHLAAVSHVQEAHRNPALAYEVNTLGTVRLLGEFRRQHRTAARSPTLLVVGSAEQYGRHEQDEMPLEEDAEQRPLTLYAATKSAQEVAALQAFRSDDVKVICVRSFNHSGAGQDSRFLLPSLVSRALRLSRDGGPLVIGNGDTVRDFLHVRDVVTAYLYLLERGTPGQVYNVSSGTGISVRDLAGAVLRRVGVTADVTTDPALARPVDVPILVGSNAKLRHATGWAPALTRDDIIDDLIHAATR